MSTTISDTANNLLSESSNRAPSGLLLFEGIVLLLLGLAAVALPIFATFAVTILLGWVFLIGGVAGFITALISRHAPGFWWSLLSAVLGIIVGTLLLGWPVRGIFSLTMLLIVLFTVDGVASIMYGIKHKYEPGAQ